MTNKEIIKTCRVLVDLASKYVEASKDKKEYNQGYADGYLRGVKDLRYLLLGFDELKEEYKREK